MQRRTGLRFGRTIAATHAIAATACLFLAAMSIAFWPRAAAAQTIPSSAAYSCDFENSWCDFTEQSALGDVPSGTARRSSIVAPGRNGSTAVRLHTEPGDNSVHGSGTWERDDLTLGPSASYCNEGQEEWWAASVMFPSDYVYPPGPEGGVVLDFHHNSSSGLPNMSIDTMPGTGMRQRGYGGASLNGGQYTAQIADPYGAVGDVTRNQWYDFVFHVKWSSNSDGYMEAWLNGKKFQMYNGATLYSGISCYLKLANYHAAFGQASSIIFDRVIRGTSANVAIEALEGVTGGVSAFTQPSSSTPYTNPSASNTTTTPTTGGTTTPATGATTVSGAGGSGSASTSATMDSSAYTIAAGQSVTFTAAIIGNGGTPSGSISFDADGSPIAGCSGIALSGGKATCTTSSLSGGSHAITGTYSGDSAYSAAIAGPITQTVTGSAPATPPSTGATGQSASATAVNTLVTHYYQAILHRAPDAPGLAFWSGEASTTQALGMNVNEAFYAMAQAFFASAEYAALNESDSAFVTDLYNTFLNRAPDATGLAYWTGQLAAGVPREVLIPSFMFANEFMTYMQGMLGTATVRPEIDTVGDFYRGVLGRLPDASGFGYWLQQFRAAQCQGTTAVASTASAISGTFVDGSEYAGRNRTNAQFVGDLYNAFLRRGGDASGVQYWISQLDSGAQSREAVRQAFVASPEFAARVSTIASQTCMP